MYIVDAFWSVVPGNEAKAQAALEKLAADVEASEPDTLFYLVHHPNLDPGVRIFPPPAATQIAFVEGYTDRAAFDAHVNGPVFQQFVAEHGALFLNMYGPETPFVIVQALELTDGFIRPQSAEPDVYQVEARWMMKPGRREEVKRALVDYIRAVFAYEPGTYMYTASMLDLAPDSPSIPPWNADALTFNSSWKDFQAFLDHGSAAPYQDFLNAYGHLFVQAGPGSTTHPYMTTSVLKRFAGFFREKAFILAE